MPRSQLSQKASRSVLNQETDARFWAQTGYKVGQPLNPRDPADRAMMKSWLDALATVQREDREGRLHVTYDDPAVQAQLAAARAATEATRAHVAAAAASPDPVQADDHLRAASEADAAATRAARQAAVLQPPTISPVVVQASAAEAARATGAPPPPSVLADLPAGHPAVSSPAARPALPADAIVEPVPEDAPPVHDHPDAHDPAPPRDVLAESRAQRAPGVSVTVHEDAQRAPRGRGKRRVGTPPAELARLRAGAQDTARGTPGDFVGVSLSPDGRWVASSFASGADAAQWYGDFTADPAAYRYAAWFDKTRAGQAAEETLGDRTSDTRVVPPAPVAPPTPAPPPSLSPDAVRGPEAFLPPVPVAPPVSPAPPADSPWKPLLILGGVALVGGIAIAAWRGRGPRPSRPLGSGALPRMTPTSRTTTTTTTTRRRGQP